MKIKSLVFLLIFSLFNQAFAAWTGGKTQPGTTTINGKSYYSISTPNHLAWFAATVNGGKNTINAVLSANIVMGADETKTCGTNWTTIGSSSKPFNGIFEGNGKVIYGLKASGSNVGLFGYVGSSGSVKNLRLNVGSVTSSEYAGAVVAHNYGTIYNVGNNSVKVTSTVSSGTAYLYAGGIAGENKGEIRYCFNKASISAKASVTSNNLSMLYGYAGGIAAVNEKLIWNSVNYAWVGAQMTANDGMAASYAGGISGTNDGEIKHVSNHGEVVGQSSARSTGSTTDYGYAYAGGLVGMSNNGAKLWDALSTSKVKGSVSGDYYVGGAVAVNSGTVGDCVIYDKTVLANKSAVGKNNGSIGKKVEGRTTAQMKVGSFAYDMNMLCGTKTSSNGVWTINGGYAYVAMLSDKKTNKIVFKNGSTTLSTQYSNAKGQVAFPATPSAAENYVFEGWFTSGGTQVSASSVFTQNETVSAKFKDMSNVFYDISFFNWDSTLIESQSVQYGKTYVYEGTPLRESTEKYSYSFKGWDKAVVPAKADAKYYAVYDSLEIEVSSSSFEEIMSSSSEVSSSSLEEPESSSSEEPVDSNSSEEQLSSSSEDQLLSSSSENEESSSSIEALSSSFEESSSSESLELSSSDVLWSSSSEVVLSSSEGIFSSSSEVSSSLLEEPESSSSEEYLSSSSESLLLSSSSEIEVSSSSIEILISSSSFEESSSSDELVLSSSSEEEMSSSSEDHLLSSSSEIEVSSSSIKILISSCSFEESSSSEILLSSSGIISSSSQNQSSASVIITSSSSEKLSSSSTKPSSSSVKSSSSVGKSSSSAEKSSSSMQKQDIPSIVYRSIHIDVSGKALHVSGVPHGEKYAIFNMQGSLVHSGYAVAGSIDVTLNSSGSYLLYTAGRFKKLSIK